MEFLAWPAAALVLGLVGLFTLRKPLVRLIDRTKKIGKLGLEATEQPPGEAITASPGHELMKAFDNALVVEQEGRILADLDNLKIPKGGERERVLVRYLAAFQILHAFERIYGIIWGSQFGALQSLNTLGSTGADIELLRPLYNQAATNDPDVYQGYTFDHWLRFLATSGLVAVTGRHVAITLMGREFLKHVVDQGYSFNKAG